VVVCHLQNTTKHDHVAFLVVVGADPRTHVTLMMLIRADLNIYTCSQKRRFLFLLSQKY
jgi:hypothetical protein